MKRNPLSMLRVFFERLLWRFFAPFAASCALLVSPVQAQQSNTIRWLLLDIGPYHLVTGPNQGQGLRDQYLKALIQKLPTYQHQWEPSSTERIAQYMQDGQAVCSLSMLKVPEREVYTHFSAEPFFRQLPVVLIVRKGYVPPGGWKKRPGGEVSLVDLLRSGEVKVGVLPKRRFGAPMDDVIKQARLERPEQVLYFNENGVLAGLLHTLGQKRFDVTLGYAIEAEQLRKSNPKTGEFDYVALAEAPGLVPTYISCSRTPWGLQVLQAIEQLPGMDLERARMREQYEALLPPQERQVYRTRMSNLSAGAAR